MSEKETKIEDPGYAAAKELFEYEMTQVRIMLEGEFASISGKDMHKDGESFIDESKLVINEIKIDDAEMLSLDISIPETPKINLMNAGKNPDFAGIAASQELLTALNKTVISLPADVSVPKTENPAVQKARDFAVPAASISEECLNAMKQVTVNPQIEVNIPETPHAASVQVKTDFDFKGISASEDLLAALDKTKISIPAVSAERKTKLSKDSFTVPQIKSFSSFSMKKPVFETNRVQKDIKYEDVGPIEPVMMEIKLLNPVRVDIPKVPDVNIRKELKSVLSETSVKIPDIQIPETFDINLSDIRNVTKDFVSIAGLREAEDRISTADMRKPAELHVSDVNSVQINLPHVPEDVFWKAGSPAQVLPISISADTEISYPDRIEGIAPNEVHVPIDIPALDLNALRKAESYHADIRKSSLTGIKDYSFANAFHAPEPKKKAIPASVEAAEKALAASKVVYTYEDIMNR